MADDATSVAASCPVSLTTRSFRQRDGDISAVVFLYASDTQLVSLAILNLDDAGEIEAAAAMATPIVAASTAV